MGDSNMSLFLADIALMPGGPIAWVLVGLISGWLAGNMMKGGGFGMLGDILVGLVGALVGGFLMSFFVQGDMGFWGSILVSFFGACIFIAITRAFSVRRAV
jgi:uncharacterized membrane protein YeaQ/YmgE (transglycosylase-associated protein family)